MTTPSALALDYMEQSGKKRTHTDIVAKAVAEYPGRTASELRYVTGLDAVEVRRRLVNCEQEGLCEKGPKKRPSGGGMVEYSWWPVARQGMLL